MTIGYTLCCFRMYLIDSSQKNVTVTDHLSLLSVCNGKSERVIKRS